MNKAQHWLHGSYITPTLKIGTGSMAGHIRGDRNRIADSPALNITIKNKREI